MIEYCKRRQGIIERFGLRVYTLVPHTKYLSRCIAIQRGIRAMGLIEVVKNDEFIDCIEVRITFIFCWFFLSIALSSHSLSDISSLNSYQPFEERVQVDRSMRLETRVFEVNGVELLLSFDNKPSLISVFDSLLALFDLIISRWVSLLFWLSLLLENRIIAPL